MKNIFLAITGFTDIFVTFCSTTGKRRFDSLRIHSLYDLSMRNRWFWETMSYSEINNQELYFHNLTLENMNNNFAEHNEGDDLFYEAELVPFNDTHDCLRLLQTSEVNNPTCIYCN